MAAEAEEQKPSGNGAGSDSANAPPRRNWLAFLRSFLLSLGAIVGWTSKVLLVLGFIVICGYLLVELASFGPGPAPQIQASLVAAWLTLIALVAAIFIVYVVWRLVRRLWRFPFGTWAVFGPTTTDRLLGLGICMIVVSKGVIAVLSAPVFLLLQLLDQLPHQAIRLSSAATASRGDRTTSGIDEALMRMASVIADLLGELARATGKTVETLLVPEVLLFLALWALLGHLLSDGSSLGAQRDRGTPGVSRIRNFIVTMPSAQRYGIVLMSVFLAGTYLSIAAIVAIPWLHEEKISAGLNRDGLEKALNGILPTSAIALDEGVKQLLGSPDDPLAPIKEGLVLRTSGPGGTDSITFYLSRSLDDASEARRLAVEVLNRLPSEIMAKSAQMKQTALSAFDLETSTAMGSVERGYFIRDIQRAVSSDYQQLERSLRACSSAIQDANKRFLFAFQLSKQVSARTGSMPLDGSRERSFAEVKWLDDLLKTASKSLRDNCEVPVVSGNTYIPPEPGSAWGPFGIVARWLLRTKSMALTLITGMLGFGLLGSVIATFVRTGSIPNATPLSAEIASIVVRGLSAAVVVFLAVKGGLAVFSAGESEPNAYVVFFTCLIGAVYSEDVWKWAQAKFLTSFADKSQGGSATLAESISKRGSDESSMADPAKQ